MSASSQASPAFVNDWRAPDRLRVRAPRPTSQPCWKNTAGALPISRKRSVSRQLSDSSMSSRPQAHPSSQDMLDLISGFWISQAIYVAAKLGIADLLQDGPKS